MIPFCKTKLNSQFLVPSELLIWRNLRWSLALLLIEGELIFEVSNEVQCNEKESNVCFIHLDSCCYHVLIPPSYSGSMWVAKLSLFTETLFFQPCNGNNEGLFRRPLRQQVQRYCVALYLRIQI